MCIKIPVTIFEPSGPRIGLAARYDITQDADASIKITFGSQGADAVTEFALVANSRGGVAVQTGAIGVVVDAYLAHLGVKAGDDVELTVRDASASLLVKR